MGQVCAVWVSGDSETESCVPPLGKGLGAGKGLAASAVSAQAHGLPRRLQDRMRVLSFPDCLTSHSALCPGPFGNFLLSCDSQRLWGKLAGSWELCKHLLSACCVRPFASGCCLHERHLSFPDTMACESSGPRRDRLHPSAQH